MADLIGRVLDFLKTSNILSMDMETDSDFEDFLDEVDLQETIELIEIDAL